ncbi:MAG: c-type cytochrome biogenesis protein CcsB [Oscillospiraceae bacterium]|nr:c-type cytochrome biogenesis protein CcsB [Oscillospiraceae bacterium]
MRIFFFVVVGLYTLAMVLQFAGAAFKKQPLAKSAFWLFVLAFAAQTVFTVLWGVRLSRLPLSNQFEFSNAFAWGVALFLIVLSLRLKIDWLNTVVMPMVALLLMYAALQRMSTDELSDPLRSVWFGIHIGSAVFSYAAFAVAGGAGLRYVIQTGRGADEQEAAMMRLDFLGYRLIAFGFLLLTVVILTGAIWAEDAWGAFWAWDPKEVWALITWIIYAVYLHRRLRGGKTGLKMAWFAIVAVPVVLFTFAGVNTLIPGLHSYG